jgi:glutamyl-tRNA synthetase
MSRVRVRFAPSPTGALHIGGVRTALYNYLLARKMGGEFILRIEDTDQGRYVPGAEAYILEALEWCGLRPDEGPGIGGDFGPYRQSERKDMYLRYAQELVERGHGYYAFDTPEELDALREASKQNGQSTFKYDSAVRTQLRNSLTMPAEEVRRLLDAGEPCVIRLKVPEEGDVLVHDIIRGEVCFQAQELDDKVMLKADGMPTYHLANIIDDRLMQITHVIRGEEWLPSTAHHVLLYRAFGWEDQMPKFAHLPLILKPSGNGKLSKRDGVKLGIPVFPLAWEGEDAESSFTGFREYGFEPAAVVNFLALLGWNPGTEQEIFSLDELVDAFTMEKIGKSGARFDFDKAVWFNQQYLLNSEDADIAARLQVPAREMGYRNDLPYLEAVCRLMKPRVTFFHEILKSGPYLFEPVTEYDEDTIAKKWKPEFQPVLESIAAALQNCPDTDAAGLEACVKASMDSEGAKPGQVFPLLRLALAGTMQGPAIFDMMELLGAEESASRIRSGLQVFHSIANS